MTDRPGTLEVVQIEPWKQYSWLRHGFSTRSGGVSSVYGEGSLNLGWTKEDQSENVIENRRRFVDRIAGTDSFTLTGARQIHSAISLPIRREDGPFEGKLATPDGKAILEADGLITSLPGVLLAVGTADCVPVLVVDTRKRAVAAFHAGWRGTVARIVENGIATMRQEYHSQPEDLIAAIGPSIGACCYSVGDEVKNEFTSSFQYAEQLFRQLKATEGDQEPASTLYLDLWQANRRQLLDAGLKAPQITVVGACTACSRDPKGERRFFSHRSERGNAGRMLNVVGIVN